MNNPVHNHSTVVLSVTQPTSENVSPPECEGCGAAHCLSYQYRQTDGCTLTKTKTQKIHSIHLGAQRCWNPMIDIYTNSTYTHVFIQPWLILISIQLFPHYVAFEAQCCDWRQIGFAALPLGIKYDISYWMKNESIQAQCPQRHRWSDCLIQCSCFTKGTHMGALPDLHHKTLGKKFC